jgi:hypothetical protein
LSRNGTAPTHGTRLSISCLFKKVKYQN